MSNLPTRTENPDFLEFTYRELWLAAGAQLEDAQAVARGVSLGDRMGKLSQGLGVLDCILFALGAGNLNLASVPELVDEGPSWALYDGHQATGFWTLTKATLHAIEKARTTGIAIAMARRHNDAGSFFTYTSLALEHDMFALASNNSPPLVSPWGGMENVLSGAPFSAASPGGEEPPLITDFACIPLHDGNMSEAAFNGQKLKGKYLVDPNSGELTDDPQPYVIPVSGYGRFCASRAASVFDSPRLYAMNVFTEMLSSIIVPGATITPELPHGKGSWKQKWDGGSVGGSAIIVIDPACFGSIDDVKGRSDRFVRKVKAAKTLPDVDEIHLPGERGYRAWQDNAPVEILETHWQPFLGHLERYGLDIDTLKSEWRAQ